MTRRTPDRLLRAVASVVTLLAVVVGAPLVLVGIARARFGSAHPLAGVSAPWTWSLGNIETGLREPVADDTVVDAVLRIALTIAWIGVAVIVVTVVAEFVHQIRHRGMSAPQVRGLGWAQTVARWVVTGLIVLPAFTPNALRVSALEPAEFAWLTDRSQVLEVGVVDALSPTGDSTPAHHTAPSERRATATSAYSPRVVSHEVQPGESVYAIAEQLTGGDAARTVALAHEILDANLGRVMPDGQRFTNPAFIQVGWVLEVPALAANGTAGRTPARGVDERMHVVAAGETLSSIAANRLGDPDRWVDIWEENAHRAMPGGRVFGDPNVILPGWALRLPGVAATTASGPNGSEPGEPEIDRPTDEPQTNETEQPHETQDPGADRPTGEPATPATAPTGTEDPRVTRPERTAETQDTVEDPEEGSAIDNPLQTNADQEATPEDGDTGPVTARLDQTIGLERAALTAAGVLALAAVLRHRRMRSATIGARLPAPTETEIDIVRRLSHDPAVERLVRVEAALRAAASHCVHQNTSSSAASDETDPPSRIAVVRVSPPGTVTLTLTADAELPAPWVGEGVEWALPASVPVDAIAADARRAGDPCLALASIGVTPEREEVLVDLEAAGVLWVDGPRGDTDDIVRAITTSLCVAERAEAVHLIGDTLTRVDQYEHLNAHVTDSLDGAIELAADLAGATRRQNTTSFELRARRTGADVWEPAVVLLTNELFGGSDDCLAADYSDGGFLHGEHPDRQWPTGVSDLYSPAHGLALVTPRMPPGVEAAWTLAAGADGWSLDTPFGTFAVEPIGVSVGDTDRLGDLLAAASALPVVDELTWADGAAAPADAPPPFVEAPHEIVVRLFGSVQVVDRQGVSARFTRSKSAELVAWLVTHRGRATRTAARTALWDLDVRDATFANVVSEARRTLARLVEPPKGEWLPRTLTEELPLDGAVTADAELIRARFDHARTLRNDRAAIDVLRPILDLVSDAPFAGTDFLWPDAEGITSNLVLLAVGACTELATRALQMGDIELLFAATDRGLRVLPGHEEMIALRMRAHARSGDTAGVRHEWESYERAILADPWSDGEPAPRLQAVRAELLGQS